VNTPDLLAKIPDQAWTPAYDAHDQVRDGAWVAELTGLMELGSWPARRPRQRRDVEFRCR
jgi:hypothetical protein